MTRLVSTLITVLIISSKPIDYLALLQLIGCLSQTTTFNEATADVTHTLPINFSVTTDQSSTDETTQNQPQSRMLCTLLSQESAATCQLPGRNSNHTYIQSLPQVADPEGLSTSRIDVARFAIEPTQPPEECLDAFLHVYCFFVVRPCDPVTDTRLPICQRSCEAFTKLRSDGVCADLEEFITTIVARVMGSFEVLSRFYFGFDCRNTSTYDFYDDMLNFTQDGSCTHILSPDTEDKILSNTPTCQLVPSGICSTQPGSTGYYFSQHNYHNEESVTQLLDNVKISTTNEMCRNTELFTDLVCLFSYPPCVAETRAQLAICDETETCTTVSTFIKDCIIRLDTQKLPITELFHAMVMNLSCSQPYLIPGVEVDQNNCIKFATAIEGPNYNLLIILTSSIVGSLALITIGVSVVIIFVHLRRKRQVKTMEFPLQATMPKNSHEGFDLTVEEDSETAGYVCSETTDVVSLTEMDKKHYRTLFSSVLVSYDKLKIGDGIGEGAFGKVLKGRLLTSNSTQPLDVAIKTIKNVPSHDELKAFFAESLIMKDFNHPNVLGLTGVCFDTPDGYPFLILPYMVNGSLKDYLRNSRVNLKNVDTFPKNLSQSVLVQMCMDIARGMKYLADMKFVHRDLAARNCMIDHKLNIKVGDFGLARDVYSSDYYRANKRTKLPVKWMPPETLHDGISNEKTDVWSYGVTCWEVFSLGRTPYPGISNHDILKFISTGGRLDKPTLCPHEIYSIVKQCWELRPEDRPDFTSIYDQMEDYFEKEHAYVVRSLSTDHPIPS